MVGRHGWVTRGSAVQSGKQVSRSLQQSVAGAAGEALTTTAEMHCDVQVEIQECEEGAALMEIGSGRDGISRICPC